MSVTKEEVLAKAKELGATLTEEEVNQFVKDGKLPEKHSSYAQKKEELKGLSVDQLIEKILETSGEARDRRLEAKEYKQKVDELTRQINSLKEVSEKYPELEKQFNSTQEVLKGIKDSEKKRREATVAKLDKSKAEKISYLLNVDTISSDQFDSTVELLTNTKSKGADAPPPAGGEPPKITLSADEKKKATEMGLSDEQYAELQNKRNKK